MTPLKDLRERQFLSQVALAKKAGVTESTINRLERGLEKPRWVTIHKLAAALGVEPGEIEFQTTKPAAEVKKPTPQAAAKTEEKTPPPAKLPGERKTFSLMHPPTTPKV